MRGGSGGGASKMTSESGELSRPGHCSGQPFLSPGGLPNPETEPRSPTLQADSLPAEPSGRPFLIVAAAQNSIVLDGPFYFNPCEVKKKHFF